MIEAPCCIGRMDSYQNRRGLRCGASGQAEYIKASVKFRPYQFATGVTRYSAQFSTAMTRSEVCNAPRRQILPSSTGDMVCLARLL